MIDYKIKLKGTITDSNGHKLDFTEADVTNIDVQDPINPFSKLITKRVDAGGIDV